MINPAAEIQMRRAPWTCLIVDDFLDAAFLGEALQALRIGEFEQAPDDRLGVRFQALGSLPLARFFMGREFREFVSARTQTPWKFDATSWIQLRQMTSASTPLPRHTDRLPGRQAVALFYLNEAWPTANGGELCLHAGETGADEVRIAPKLNRLVFFESNERTWHSVRPVRAGTRLNVSWEMSAR
ncbi:MAG: 2OG-Fe(II) oxygenase [Bdellovibrionaceae bacterium]|nr:2OG-Fe(II) oxygenase [Pseudobdellovibrionaceae bacterium]